MPLEKIAEIKEILRAALAEKPEIDDNLAATAEAYGGTRSLVAYAFAKTKQLETELRARTDGN